MSSEIESMNAGIQSFQLCSCGEGFCLCCGEAPHEPAPCAAESWPIDSRDSVGSRAVATDMGLRSRKLFLSPRC